jgi:molybdopterin molybdotransferase
MSGLMSVAVAQQKLLALATPGKISNWPFELVCGHILAADIVAKRTQPAADLSAMDGYAMRLADGPGPWTIIGESAAGAPFLGTLKAGQAVRISTGAKLPDGADAILVQEQTLRDGDQLSCLAGYTPSAQCVRAKGCDFQKGDVLAARGTRITPAIMGLIKLGGYTDAAIYGPPTVQIMSTGSELVPDAHGQIALPDSNGVMLTAMVQQAGGVSLPNIILGDDLDALIAAIFSHKDKTDIIVSTGGVSVGDHDLIVPALTSLGADIQLHKIAMRPGKPLLIAKLGDCVFLGLPGNPVSAFVTAQLFLLPLIRKIMGEPSPLPHMESAVLGQDLPANGPRDHYLRGVLQDGVATPMPDQDSSLMYVVAQANCLILHSANKGALFKGASVQILQI